MIVVWTALSYGVPSKVPSGVPRRLFSPHPWDSDSLHPWTIAKVIYLIFFIGFFVYEVSRGNERI